ncbi:MAG: Eco57I restriction-modification methylase domain-containing protein [Nitrosomonadales bacterium]|nr:Eco57I restriction-modification methylase domain-containing protein [Nitrosomonadales bacterium]
MVAPKEVLKLIENFEHNLDAYRGGKYNETQVRRDFIDPFFKALGWDMDNSAGYAETYRDVIHEDAIKIGNSVKAPDYSFRIGGQRKFFLEAKKPSVNVREDIEPAFQLRRYAWSAKLPLSIVTDFEEFAIYDCRQKPVKSDKASKARLFYCTFRDYAERWDEIAAIFSKEAVLKGSFDKYAGSSKGKRGTSEVDSAFLDEIENWRDLLARNIALRNPNLSQRELNFAVQQTIDRIIFLRICEDRGIEPYGKLMALQNGASVYARLREMFRDADDRYNSGLFHFSKEKNRAGAPDELTLHLNIDDKPLKEIFKNLYYPDCPYEFSVLGADILGSVYEQFLGKVIRLTAGNRAVVEDKPEVKKAGGVFYTPAYIVQYIVQHTVGKLLEGKTPKQAKGIAILDPACGSGSFLIGAYQYLLDWYLERYVEEGAEKHSKGKSAHIRPGAQQTWRLTTAEKKRILLEHIYGVDIDAQAAEVTKLSLLLKMLEGESDETLNSQMKLFHERVLPDLEHNIQCGNSLIGPDFYDGKLELDTEEAQRINVFDWQTAFPQIFEAGGFDAVIGNPPYIRIQTMKEWAPLEVEHYKERYLSAGKGNYDIYVVFVERGLQLLNKRGRLGFILPHKFFNAQYGEPLRGLIAIGSHLADIVHFGHQQVFAGATTYTCLLFLDRAPGEKFPFVQVDDLRAWRQDGTAQSAEIYANQLSASEWNFSAAQGGDLRTRLLAMPIKLGEVAHIFVGLQTSADKVFVLEHVRDIGKHHVVARDAGGTEWQLERGILKPFLSHVSLASYAAPQAQHWLIFPYALEGGQAKLMGPDNLKKLYPNVWAYLEHSADALKRREGGKLKNSPDWYGYVYRKNLVAFDEPKLVVQVISQTGRYAFDNNELYFTGGGNGPYYGVRWKDAADQHSLHYLQALLNSRLLDYILHSVSSPFRGGYWSYGKRFIEQLPVRAIDFTNIQDRSTHDHAVALVEKMLALHPQLAAAKTPHESNLLQRQIAATDNQIDQLVYQLYGLTDEEIALVEGAQ